MKWFWLLVVTLVGATLAVLWWPQGGPRPGVAPEHAPAPDQAASPDPGAWSPALPSPPASDDPLRSPETSVVGARLRAPAPQPPTASPEPSTDPLGKLNDLLGIEADSVAREEEFVLPAAPSPADAVALMGPPVEEEEVVVPDEKFKEVVKARIRETEDGWLLLDERFPIRGAGTAADPFEVSWDLLVSASETYQPRQGKTRLPERITMLDGKHVRITGYVAFPIMALSQDELLSMRNMWDGCCIGIPPTPYDAIEVRLAKSATGRDRFTSFGTIEGRFVVDPYVKGNWLLGLYMLEDAALHKVQESLSDPARHGM